MMRLSSQLRRLMLALTLLVLHSAGCGDAEDSGPTGTVTGTVKLNGKPLTQGAISFYNPDSGFSGGADLGEGGKFTLTDPLPVGTYVIAVNPPEAPQPEDEATGRMAMQDNSIPLKYREGSSSGLKSEVKEGENTFSYELQKKG